MNNDQRMQSIKRHWQRDRLSQAIRDAIVVSGKSLDTLTIDDLAPLDQFHGGGQRFTVRLARLAETPSTLGLEGRRPTGTGESKTPHAPFLTGLELYRLWILNAVLATDWGRPASGSSLIGRDFHPKPNLARSQRRLPEAGERSSA